MSLQRCINGHIYDTAKHRACPKCGAGPDVVSANPKRPENGEWRSRTMGEDEADEPGVQPSPTVGPYMERIDLDPVVGWLVCTNGPERGRDYRIYVGSNSIGRAETMRICIARDKEISRLNHAFIIFDPESNKFFVSPGTAQGLAHHNRRLVNQAVELRPFDEIKVGGTTLLFVPFLSEFGAPNFRWA